LPPEPTLIPITTDIFAYSTTLDYLLLPGIISGFKGLLATRKIYCNVESDTMALCQILRAFGEGTIGHQLHMFSGMSINPPEIAVAALREYMADDQYSEARAQIHTVSCCHQIYDTVLPELRSRFPFLQTIWLCGTVLEGDARTIPLPRDVCNLRLAPDDGGKCNTDTIARTIEHADIQLLSLDRNVPMRAYKNTSITSVDMRGGTFACNFPRLEILTIRGGVDISIDASQCPRLEHIDCAYLDGRCDGNLILERVLSQVPTLGRIPDITGFSNRDINKAIVAKYAPHLMTLIDASRGGYYRVKWNPLLHRSYFRFHSDLLATFLMGVASLVEVGLVSYCDPVVIELVLFHHQSSF
jgi:hypothetical protein